MPFYEIKFIPNNGSTGGKYRFFDTVYYNHHKLIADVKKDFQEILKTKNVRATERSSW